jgi:hypothetical protein
MIPAGERLPGLSGSPFFWGANSPGHAAEGRGASGNRQLGTLLATPRQWHRPGLRKGRKVLTRKDRAPEAEH